ncbi:MAG: MBL fold metallo-hydrolase [Spirochaetes bacterium]|nr:MBL fold metallo-hydrolase [Spirochaetota bacterium]
MTIDQIMVTHMAVFCYLVADESSGEAVLIDPAGDHDIIFGAVERRGANVRYVINTHGHFDHTSGNDYAVKRTGAQLLIHEADVRKLGSLTSRFFSRTMGGKTSPPPGMTITDGDIIGFGAEQLRVIHTPGHSEGSVCLYAPGNVFTGDTLFTEGMGRTDLPDGSEEKIMDSIINKILALPDDTVIWPGHHYGRRPASTVREQKRYYL